MRQIRELKDYIPVHEIFSLFAGEEDAVFLDSSLENELGQYSLIARRSYLKLVNGERFTVNGVEQQTSFGEYLKKYLDEHKEENPTDLPVISGAVGYFSYDYGMKREGIESGKKDGPAPVPDCIMNFYDEFIVEDLKARKVWIVANGHLGEAGASLDRLEEAIGNRVVYHVCHNNKETEAAAGYPAQKEIDVAARYPAKKEIDMAARYPSEKGDKRCSSYTSDFSKEEYLKAVQDMIDYIVEGDIYIANMTRQLRAAGKRSPYEVFERLRKANPSPFGGYLNYGDFQIVCASPERFLRMKDGVVETRPIKGTRKRGSTAKEDESLRQELLDSQKDRSELLMIVDLERNDLNKVCRPGSVKVNELFSLEEYATVFHLSASIRGELEEGKNAMDLIEAAFPGGSITGAPKRRAMEIIEELEHSKRGLYTGTIGYIGLDGSCDFNIVIRTAVFREGSFTFGAGGGITCESELEFEYEETLQKARALLEAIC